MHDDDERISSLIARQGRSLEPAPAATRQAITGLTPPDVREALVRECRPTLAARGGLARLGAKLTRTVILAPFAWVLLAPLFALKFAPFFSRRYRLTNRRLAICRGLRASVLKDIALAEIEDVRLDPASVDTFYGSGTLEILSDGEVRLRLPGVPEPEGFRQTILNTCAAWVPRKAKSFHVFVAAKPTP